MTAAVVADRTAYIFGNRSEVADERINGFVLQRGVARNGFVQVGDVSGVVLAVVNLHRHRVDVRFQCVFRIGKWW